ncbi:sperm flagellar protein 1-like [Rhynchophorus ferrugineus]|uniref:Calponin-homology (CH) domain-containing protein n=1 Tax=Rhynchophorus ferrugineus TaxID=354439 RepID=A0A834MHX8_RHYFE|nr:hypothetical protein GWI33_001773 [Rhynchophorus ferrugineus]
MDQNLDELYRWIDDHQITRQKRHLSRDFSDAVPLAEILKKHYPKMVDLHNYSPRNAIAQKVLNWDIINKKVLNKLKINLSHSEQEQLAKAVPGAIERLLFKIKTKVEKKNSDQQNGDNTERVYYLDGISNQEHGDGVVPIKIKSGTKTLQQKMVPAEIFDKMERDIREKEELNTMLKDKMVHLEKMLSIKDERIKDLTQQLQALISGNVDTTTSPRTRFFNKIF